MQKENKEYLNQYLAQEPKIRRLKELYAKNTTHRAFYLAKINECETIRDEIEAKIESMENPLHREILYQKYVFGKTLEEIGYIIHYSTRHTERLHLTALENFRK